jgi:DNA polymerase-3 subunit gamma/tau
MSYQVLARKWRPRTFAAMVGQGHVLKALSNALGSNRLHHAYLFTGTRGVGKTTLARILAKCLNCETGVTSNPCGTCSACRGIDEGRFVDLIEVDAASRARVDETRELMDNVAYAPAAGRFKVYLIDEVHMFSSHSFNALLKTLEEPPPHVKFLLATTEPKKLPVTILSRCLQFNLKHLTAEQIAVQLRVIVDAESIAADDSSLRMLARAADGSMRDALSLLDQAVAHGNGKLEHDQLRDMLGAIDSVEVAALLGAIAAGNGAELVERMQRIAAHNPDYHAILGEVLALLHDIALLQALPEATAIDDETTRALARSIGAEDVQLYYQIALHGRRDMYSAPDPATAFEMILVRMLAFRPGTPAARSAGPTREPAPARTPAAAPAARTVAAAPAVSAAGADWQQIIDEMALAGLVKEFAGHCVLKERSAERVHLVLAPAQEHLLKTTQKERLQEAIRTRFGQHMKVQITVEDPDAETPAQRKERETRERQQQAVRSMESDPNVRTLIDMFDATLDKTSVRPVQ